MITQFKLEDIVGSVQKTKLTLNNRNEPIKINLFSCNFKSLYICDFMNESMNMRICGSNVVSSYYLFVFFYTYMYTFYSNQFA